MRNFLSKFRPDAGTRILDVGGTLNTWETLPIRSEVTLVNLRFYENPPSSQSRFKLVEGDACEMEFDHRFDIVFSNSVIEHVGDFERQRQFAHKCSDLAPNLWIQTPARSFPVEPHLLTPFIHYLPRSIQRLLLRRFTIWGVLQKPNPTQVEEFLDEVRLISFREMKDLFPDCEILRERFMGLTKSYIAVRRQLS